MRKSFMVVSAILLVTTLALSIFLDGKWYPFFGIILFFTLMGYYDMLQKKT